MATATNILLTPSSPAIIRIPSISQSAADHVNSLLQANHRAHHITFDELGRHNHIVHHLLASFSLGADPETLQKQYDQNAEYQRPPPPENQDIIHSLSDPDAFKAQMSKPDNYTNFLIFFARLLQSSSIPEVLNEYVFADTDLARKMFNHAFAGFYHPFIHLGYGVEFNQPAIVAEALAQACVHPRYLGEFFIGSAEASKTAKPATLVHLINRIRDDGRMRNAVQWDDGSKVRDGILGRVKEEMIAYAAQWQVPLPAPADSESVQVYLEEKAAEAVNAAAFMAGAAQNPPKIIKMDFIGMHAVTSSIFLTDLVRQPWLSDSSKAKLIEWKGRLDLVLYASLKSPKLLVDEIRAYPADGATLRDWADMLHEAALFLDDGHTVKFVRALKNGEEACSRFEKGRDGGSTNGIASDERWQIRGDMWKRLAMMVLDSVQPDQGVMWIRNVGFTQSWDKYPSRPSLGVKL